MSDIPWTPSSTVIDEMWAGDGESDPMTESVPDMLETLFAKQRQYMLEAWPKEMASGLSVPTASEEWGELHNRRVLARIHENFGFLVRELSEAMQHLDGSKSWKANPRPTDVEEYREEIADVLHFFIEMCILSGITAEGLFREYFKKSLVNSARVVGGY